MVGYDPIFRIDGALRLPNSESAAGFGVTNVTIKHVSQQAACGVRPGSSAKILAGFFLSGFLFTLPGVLLLIWGYHRDPPEFVTIGNFFLAVAGGVMASPEASKRLLARGGVPLLLVFSSVLACVSLLALALVPPPAAAGWRIAGLLLAGLAAGMLNTGLFHALSGSYRSQPVATVVHCGVLFGVGSLAATLLAAGTLYAYTAASILVLMAMVPGFFAALYANARIPTAAPGPARSLRDALRDFRSPGAVLFALLLFFQFGNEWSLAGWLPLFLVRRLGASPTSALFLLALYWLALLVGRLVVVAVLAHVGHGRLLLGSILAAIFGVFLLYFTDNLFGAATGIVAVGCGFAAIYPLVVEKIGHRFPHFHPAFFNGIFSLALMGGMLAPASLGYFASIMDIGVVTALPVLGSSMVFILLLLIWLEAKVTGQ